MRKREVVKSINTGIRLTPSQYARLTAIAQEMGVKKNHVFGILIESAEVRSRPSADVQLIKNSDSAKFSKVASAITAG